MILFCGFYMLLLGVKWQTLCQTLKCNVSQIMMRARYRVRWWVENMARSFIRSTSEHQNDFCFNKHHSEEVITRVYTVLQTKFIVYLTSRILVWIEMGLFPQSSGFCLFPLTSSILQFKNFHQHKRSSMWNRLMRRNKANPRGLTSNRKRMCMRRRDNSIRRTRQAARRNMSHVRDGRISVSCLHVGM